MSNKSKDPLFINPLNEISGLSINDLNKYLPAIQKIDDLTMSIDQMKEGVFLGLGTRGLKKVPDNSIDLIITDPPDSPWMKMDFKGNPMTIKEYYNWNENWLNESYRILKKTGSIYLMCDWRYSGMYHSLLDQKFKIQSRISWNNPKSKNHSGDISWINKVSDIWFATKSNSFFFNQDSELKKINESKQNNVIEMRISNLWHDILDIQSQKSIKGDKPYQLIERIINASSSKLNWILDPFSRNGNVGLISNSMGRRFIGFEVNKDKVLMSMKRIDRG